MILRCKNKYGFTLVELIITITILAILWVVAFVNLRIYIVESRNTKVLSDLNSLASSLKTEIVSWKNSMAFLWDSSLSIPTLSLKGGEWPFSTSVYGAWNINFSAFQVSPEEFVDPYSDQPYKIGVTKLFPNATFQIVGTVTRSDSGLVANTIAGAYAPRQSSRMVDVTRISSQTNTVDIDIKDTWYFYQGDILESWWNTYVVKNVSSSSTSLELDSIIWLSTSSQLFLRYTESLWLIGSESDWDIPVVEWWDKFPY